MAFQGHTFFLCLGVFRRNIPYLELGIWLLFDEKEFRSIMFVKKLVEKASIKKPGGNSSDGLKASDVDPRLVFHQGVPSGGAKFTYDNIQKILALSTKPILSCHFKWLIDFLYVVRNAL
ncbi:hypothetical protein SESBI_26972 [Sesbania bispinosa]|nr:hypothetical protein SESBI_26972 [Sesbania bispinosa]